MDAATQKLQEAIVQILGMEANTTAGIISALKAPRGYHDVVRIALTRLAEERVIQIQPGIETPAKWGLTETGAYFKLSRLIPQILAEADHPLTFGEIWEKLNPQEFTTSVPIQHEIEKLVVAGVITEVREPKEPVRYTKH